MMLGFANGDASLMMRSFFRNCAGKKLKVNKMAEKNINNAQASILSRILLYIAGAILLGLGIVLCVKCEMGVSPINSIPYVAMHLVPLSLGTLSIVFYLVNIAAELILSERKQYIKILLQLPVSLLFGFVIDLWDALLPSADSLAMQIVCLCGSLFFTAFGIMLIVTAHLVPDPPTGAVQTISRAVKKPMGSVKIVYDCGCVLISLLLGLLGVHRVIGFGIATVASAILVGRILALLQSTVGNRLKRYFPETET